MWHTDQAGIWTERRPSPSDWPEDRRWRLTARGHAFCNIRRVIAVILSEEGAKALSIESAAVDFVRDAFSHLKAIASDEGGQELLKTVGRDAGVVSAKNERAVTAAKTRQRNRENSVRTLA